MATDTDTSPMVITSDAQEADAMRAAAEYRTQKAAEAKAARDEKLAPLRAIVSADGYQQIADDVMAILKTNAFADEPAIEVHLRAVAQIMPNLKAATV